AALRAVLVHLRELVERVALEPLAELTEVVAQRGGVRGIEVHEDEPFPHFGFDGRESVVGLVEIEELVLLLHERARALEVVAPAVVLAGELATGTAGLLAGEVLPDELVAPMAAHVVERADLVLRRAHDHDRGARAVELLREVAADLGQLLDAPDVQPRAPEDRLALELVPLG